MKNLFNSIQLTKPKSNLFDLSHDVKLSGNMGQLIPTLLLEAIPGDKFDISCESLIRFAPLVSPVMHSMSCTMHYFFVPNRLLWPNWQNYITNTEVGTPAALPAHPYIVVDKDGTNYTPLMDYVGVPNPSTIPTGAVVDVRVNALPFSAYQQVFNDYYRDENLTNLGQPIDNALTDGDNTSNVNNLTVLRNRAWEHDYFTAALPFAQKGNAVSIPIGEVKLNPDWSADGSVPIFQEPAGGAPNGTVTQGTTPSIEIGSFTKNAYDPDGSLEVQATTINDLRRAFKLQEWFEKMARGGSRLIEVILSHFGVRSSDKRLQRAEYIVGTKSPVVISEVLQTSETNTSPQGNMAGHGISVQNGRQGGYFCEEHGYIIGIMSVMPKTAYFQGFPKHLRKLNDPTQYYWPSFANLGEQEIEVGEVYGYQSSGEDTFGYIPRYAEYKYLPSRVCGEFRTTLKFWHESRDFATTPALNEDFITADPSHRIFAVTDPTVDKLYCHIFHKIKAVRPMPKFGTPSF